MSTSSKVVLAIIIVILIIVGIWYATSSSTQTATPAPAETSSVNTAPAQTGLNTSANDTSDNAIIQDMQSVDTQMQGLSSDSAAMNSQTTVQ